MPASRHFLMIFSTIPGDSSTSALLKYTRKLFFHPHFYAIHFPMTQSLQHLPTSLAHLSFSVEIPLHPPDDVQYHRSFFPMQSSPVTPTTISANSGITGSCTAGTFKGNLLAPSASTRRRSQNRTTFQGFRFRTGNFGCPALCFAAITYPYCSISLQSSSVSSASAKGRSSSHAMWVVVVTITRFSLSGKFFLPDKKSGWFFLHLL